ncbi:MAG: tRNA-dihydrouridine synthase family protein [Candidatus Micrarchaeota archaeon]|nr:tRNA-dihydrouridine synthase family protein [Candidatus Micrarchaeota archaeon]
MKYGNAALRGKFVLGPMAAYTDIAFRLLCRRAGAAMCFTEFANAEAIVRSGAARRQTALATITRGGKNTDALLQTCSEEMPVGIQIFGATPEAMGNAASSISARVETGELYASCIDMNFGCPAGSVIRAGAGSALLKSPQKMRAIAEACVKHSGIPVTAKIRAGWKSDSALELALMLQDAGVSGITVHWRTATEGRKRQAGWEMLREVKEALSIPVIGNGGASTPEKAVQFLKETGCDAVMIASAALGNPHIFSQADDLLAHGKCRKTPWEEKRASFAQYAALAQKYGVATPKRFRAHAIEWVSGFNGVKEARKRLNSAKTIREIEGIVSGFEPSNAQSGLA